MNPPVTVQKHVVTTYVVDCPTCPYHEEFAGPVMAYYERTKHERTHTTCPSNET